MKTLLQNGNSKRFTLLFLAYLLTCTCNRANANTIRKEILSNDPNAKNCLSLNSSRANHAQGQGVFGNLENTTVMAWINLSMSNQRDYKYIIGQRNFSLTINQNNNLEVKINGEKYSSNSILDSERWYHVGLTLANGSLKLFINGTLDRTFETHASIGNDTSLLTIGKNPILNEGFFDGKLDEIRIFNISLNDSEYQKMVYQEIENNNSKIKGSVIPKNIENLDYSSILRYYKMDIFNGNTFKDDSLNNDNSMQIINGLTIVVQQAPMPFLTRVSGNLSTAINDDEKGIRGLDAVENRSSIISINHDINQNSNTVVLGMTVGSNATITMNNNTKFQNNWYLKLDGKIDLVNNSQLIQTEESELDPSSSGHIERDQKGQSNMFNYNYWSSPVSSINSTTINHGYTVAGVMKDGTTSIPQNIQWTESLNGAPTSPITLSGFWIFKFQNFSASYANWNSIGQNGSLLPGQGYTLKGSNSDNSFQNYTFVGKPNNGTITQNVSANNLNLCGNPYPSAIDADKFIRDNINSINGTLYFWEHYDTNSSHNLSYYQGGYATRTLVGGTMAMASTLTSQNGESTKKPNRFIPVGQGFFVKGSATGGPIVFNNSQRIFVKENNFYSNFLLRAVENPDVSANALFNNQEDDFEQENFIKIHLGYDSADNIHRQILLGFMNQYATSGIDMGYDALHIENNENEMYFQIENNKYVIQGVGEFNINNSYPIGIKNAVAGTVSFSIDSLENCSSDTDIVIFDNVTNQNHVITNNRFEINLPAGTFENRFSLRFSHNSSLNTNENLLENGIKIFNANENTYVVNSLNDASVKSIEIYNILGQKIITFENNNNQKEIKIANDLISKGCYIVKVYTDKGNTSQKIVVD